MGAAFAAPIIFSAEWKSKDEALIDQRITENNSANADRGAGGLLEEIVSSRSLNRAYKRAKKNKGSGGIDGRKADELLQYLKENGDEIRKSILAGTYRPQPVRRVEIPKDNGRTRKLDIDHNVAYMAANRRRGYWYMANSPAMQTALSNKMLEKAGFVSFWSYCKSVSA